MGILTSVKTKMLWGRTIGCQFTSKYGHVCTACATGRLVGIQAACSSPRSWFLSKSFWRTSSWPENPQTRNQSIRTVCGLTLIILLWCTANHRDASLHFSVCGFLFRSVLVSWSWSGVQGQTMTQYSRLGHVPKAVGPKLAEFARQSKVVGGFSGRTCQSMIGRS